MFYVRFIRLLQNVGFAGLFDVLSTQPVLNKVRNATCLPYHPYHCDISGSHPSGKLGRTLKSHVMWKLWRKCPGKFM